MNTKIQSFIISISYIIGLEFLVLKQGILKANDIFWIIFFWLLVILSEIFWIYYLSSFKKINFLTVSKIIFISLFVVESAIFIFLFKNIFLQQLLVFVLGILFYFILWAFAQSTRHSFLAFNVFVIAAFLLVFFNFTIITNFFLAERISDFLYHFLIFITVFYFFLFLFFLHFEISSYMLFNIWILVLIFWEIFLTLSFLPLSQFIFSILLVLFLYVMWIFIIAFLENKINKNVIIESVIFIILALIVLSRFIIWNAF